MSPTASLPVAPLAAGRCPHVPPCPPATAADRDAAHVVSDHCEQGWRLLCNGVVLFDDDGELLPDGRSMPDHHTWQAPVLA
jgi:hypothetical protein